MSKRLRSLHAEVVAIVAFLVLLGGAALFSYRQPAPLHFAPNPALGSWGWWLKPIERNAVLRPAETSANLMSGALTTPQSDWVLGSGSVVGLDGNMLQYSAKAPRWLAQTSGTRYDLQSIFGTSDGKQLWAAGSEGTILHYTAQASLFASERPPLALNLSRSKNGLVGFFAPGVWQGSR